MRWERTKRRSFFVVSNMEHQFDQSPHIPEYEPSAELLSRVMSRIELERRRHILRRQLFVFSAISFFSLILSIPAWQLLSNEAARSGFNSYLSFALVDYRLALVYWQDFSISLLESLPVLGLAAIAACVFGTMLSLKKALSYRKAMLAIS